MLSALMQDIRYGGRMLLKKPGFTFVAVLALALGIGANTAIFSVINAVLLRPLPFNDPDRLVMVWGSAPQVQAEWDKLPASAAGFEDWREQNHVFEQLAAFKTWAWNLTGSNSEPEQVWGARVSADLFPVLGVKPLLGRTFLPEEERNGATHVILMGHGLWQRRFGSDPNIIGRTISLTGQSYTVVGVMPPGFKFPGGTNMLSGFRFSPQTELWEPLAITNDDLKNRGTLNLAVIGRLKPNVTLEEAQAEMTTIARRLEEQYPDSNQGLGIKLVRLHEQVVGQVRLALLVLLATVGFVLLIACANVANLLLARSTSRQKEIAIRTALGAGRARLIRQLLTESVLLALVGGAAGLLLAFWGIDALGALIPENIPRANEIGIDARMLGFTLLVSLLTGLVFGLAPALQASRTDVNESLKEGMRGMTSSLGRNRLRSLLVVCEIALALMLLVGAGLLIRSFIRLQQVSPGFDPRSVMAAEVALPFQPGAKYEDEKKQAAFFEQAIERIETIPGVESAGAVESLPLSGAVESSSFNIDGRAAAQSAAEQPNADYTEVSSHYFRAMGIPVIKGRAFTSDDRADAPGVVVINESLGRKYFAGEDPLGRRITFDNLKDPEAKWLTIVGVVGDVKQTNLNAETEPAIYLPHTQSPSPLMTLVVRTRSADPTSVAASVRGEIRALDRDIPVTSMRAMEQVLAASVSQRRFSMLLLGIFAGVALLLAAVGIYGVMAYSVTQRTHEIGIRMALGAQGGDILKLVVGQGMILALIGVAIGLAAALLLTRVMMSLLFNVSATDPLTFAAVSLLLITVALIACYIPARRAMRVDPMEALRYE
jgi:putative ABC transport system permease protein